MRSMERQPRLVIAGVHLLLASSLNGCMTVDEAPTSEPAPMPALEVPVGPPGVEEARARAAEMFPNGVSRAAPAGPLRELEAPAPTVEMTWLGVRTDAEEIPFDGTPLRLAVTNEARGPVTVRLDVLFNAGQRARSWSSDPIELPPGGSEVIELDLVREGVRPDAERVAVDVRATLEIFLGDDRLDRALDRAQRGAVREASSLRLRRRPPGESLEGAVTKVRAAHRASGFPEQFRNVEIVAIEDIDDSQVGAEDAIRE